MNLLESQNKITSLEFKDFIQLNVENLQNTNYKEINKTDHFKVKDGLSKLNAIIRLLNNVVKNFDLEPSFVSSRYTSLITKIEPEDFFNIADLTKGNLIIVKIIGRMMSKYTESIESCSIIKKYKRIDDYILILLKDIDEELKMDEDYEISEDVVDDDDENIEF